MSLADFIGDALKQMGVATGTTLPGLTDASGVTLSNVQTFTGGTAVASVEIRGASFDIIRYTPTGAQAPLLVLHTPKLNLASLMPAAAGTPLAAIGELEGLTFVYAPGAVAKFAAPPALTSDDGTPPAVFTDLQTLARSDFSLSPGMNVAAEMPLNGIAQELSSLMRAVGLNPTTKLPLRGGIGASLFKEAQSQAATAARAQLGNAAQIKTSLANMARTYGTDFVNNLNINAVIPSTSTIGPFTVSGEAFTLKGNGQGDFILGLAAQELKAFDVDITKALFTYDTEKGAIVANGAVDVASLGKRLSFAGLTLENAALASTYQQDAWAFALTAGAKLNNADITLAVAGERVSATETRISAVFDGGQKGVTARDVAGRDIPGLDRMALTKVELTGDHLVADFTFGTKNVPGEIAAFKVGTQNTPTLAFTIDKVAFGDLIPGAVGSAMDGVEVAGMSLVVVPQGSGGLKPDDAAIPSQISANLKKVIADAATHDPARANATLAEGFNLLADLDISASGSMGDMMKSAGVSETVIPVVGTISAATFQPNVPKADSLKGLNLSVPLPDLKVPGLPSTMKITKPVFAVAETAPPALSASSQGAAQGQGPFVTIGADLQLQAGQGTHDFAALLMTGKNAQGQRVINLLGSAKDPKGLFEFKGLSVSSLDLASVYDAGNWDFKLAGAAALNAAQLTFDTDIKNVDGKIVYEAVLDGGQNGISAKDVAGRDLPGLDQVALTKVTVTAGTLIADMVFGPKKAPGELAAFHVGSQTAATMAFTLDKLAFGDLVPGAAGSALDGVEVSGMSLVVVPQGGAGLKPDDAAIPPHISDNLKKVIADAATHDPTRANQTLGEGFNLLADLDLKASGGMTDMMKSAGVTQTVIPVVGTISAATFQPNVPKADSLKGLNLSVPLPDLKVPGLPDTIKITKPVFAIADTAPDALTEAAKGVASGQAAGGASQGPFITIGADLQMQAGAGTHEFAALLMTGKDAQGKRVVDLIGSAKDPKGLFEFKGLEVSSLDLASVYDAGNWDFKLNGAAQLNAAALTFETDIKKVDGKIVYEAVLDGGQNGISAKDVAGTDLPGFDTVALTKVTVTGANLVADMVFGAKKTPGELAAFHVGTQTSATLAFTLDKLAFADLVPGSAGSALDGVEIDGMSLVVVPKGGTGLKPDDAAIPAHISDNLKKVIADAATHDSTKANFTLAEGFNLLADLDLKASGGMGDMMKSAGITETVIPIVGTVSASTFQPNVPKADSLKGINLNVALPDLKVPGLPDTIKIANPVFAITETQPEALTAAAGNVAKGELQAPYVTIGADLQMQAGKGTHDFAALLMTGKDAQGKRVIDLVGSAKDPSGLFEFKGLAVKTLDLASVYDAGNWEFKLNGSADLNSAQLTFDTDIKKVDGKTVYEAVLDGGQNGISAKDVAGTDLPGFDAVALTKVTVTGGNLVADMVFGDKKTPGELAAFHVADQTGATLAFTLDKLAFADLVPGSAGSALDGVEVDGMSLVIVPKGAAALKPDDVAIPAHISDNLKKVIADAATHDPDKANHTLTEGFNMLADLDIKASGGMGDLMKSAGVTETVIPIVGTVSANTFNPKAPKADSLKGLDLNVALPDLKVPGLPDTIKIAKPVFAVTETAPEALTAAAGDVAKGELQAPYVVIGADLQMQAGKGTHDFAALLMTGKDAQGKRVVDLVGSAKDPSGLFEFKGLEVKSLDLASVYDAGNWDFKLDGSADLNAAQVSFNTDIRKVDGKTTYIAVLDGGANGISAKDVAGRDVPGMDTVALTKVTVTGDTLVADLTFGEKKTPGEIAAFHPAGADFAVMAVTLDKLAFADLVPGSAGSALDGVEVDSLSMMIVPDKSAGLKHDDATIPQHIRDNLAKVLSDAAKNDPSKSTYDLKAGFNLLADFEIKGSQGMGALMASAGLKDTVLPIVGTISAQTFNRKAPKKEALEGLDISFALPALAVPGLPDTIKIEKPIFSVTAAEPAALTAAASGVAKGDLQAPFVVIGAELTMQAGKGTHEFDALLMTGKDAQGKRVVDLLGSAKDPKGLFEFKGLTVKTLDLASLYDAGAWDFKLDGTADLNSAQVTFDTEIKKVDGKVEYVAALSGGANGISAKDVAGRDVPGFDTVALTSVVVTGESLSADFIFGKNKTAGEIAAFHPAGADKAVIAMTLDKLAFSDLLPEAAGSPLDGVEVDELSMVVVPEKNAGLKPDDASIPTHIQANLSKILTDAGKDKGFTLAKDINMFAALGITGSTGMQDLMNFIGRDAKNPIPIVGAMSPQLFNAKAPKAKRFEGMDLDVPMPNLKLAGLPGAFSLKNTEFKIADKSPLGTAGLWVGLQSDMDADLLGSKIAFKTDVGFAKGEISMAASSEQELKKPFGIKWLDLKQLALALDYDKKTKTGELQFTSIPAKPFGKTTPEIEIELKEEGGKLTAGLLKIKEKVAFADLPILNKVKHADQFDFTFLEISTSGVAGGSELHGQQVDVAVFEQSEKWTFAVSDNGGGSGFKFDRIMPVLKKTPLKDFHLNDAALIFSESDIIGKVSDLPEVSQDIFKAIYGSATAQVNVKNGITVAANFSPGKSSGFAAKGLQGIGIHDDILIEGAVVDIFGEGTPGVDILVDIEQGPGGSKGASHSPKMAKFPGQVGFFVQYQADELDVGLAADVVLHVPKKEKLDLTTKLELQLDDKGFSVDIFMDLAGQWKNPFGIHGIELDEVAIKFGIDMEGEAVFGFRGKTILADGAEKIDIAAEMDFELEAAGLPDGVAMKGSISELGIPAIIDVAERLAGGKSTINISGDLPLPEYREVTFAFATPGVSDPQLGLIGSGFMLAGELFFLNRELGKVSLNAGTTGINMDAEIDPIDFKVVKLDKNTMKLDLGFKSLPKMEIDSEIEFLGAKQTVLASFDEGMMNMTFEDKIGGGIWDSKITLGMGVDAAHSAEPDIFIEGEVKEDFFKWLRDQAPAKVREFFNKLNADFEKAKSAINNAENTVRGWNNKISARKAVIQRERANADAALQRAEARVNSVRNDANHMHDEYEHHKHRCKWYRAWECAKEAYYWGRYGIEYAAYKVAEGVLHAAQSTVDHLPSELMDPQLDWLETKQAAAMAALELAKAAINGVEDADRWISSGLSTLLRDVGKTNALVIKEIFFEADMDGMIKGEPAILTMDLEIFGDDLGTQMFAFKLTDPVYDVEQLAFVPLHMVSELFQKYVPKSLKKLLGPVLTAINNEATKAEQKVYAELKNLPGLDLPPELKDALQSAWLNEENRKWDYAFNGHAPLRLQHPTMPHLDTAGRPLGWMVASNRYQDVMDDSTAGYVMLAQAPAPAGAPPAPANAAANDNKPAAGEFKPRNKVSLKRDKQAHVADRLKSYQEKRRQLLLHMMNRDKTFGDNVVQYQQAELQQRVANMNDEFVAYTDIHVPPGELFTEKLLVARHSKLCLGQNSANKTTFHPCSENPGGLLWTTKRVLIDRAGKIIPFNEDFATKWPSRVYAQLQHNGLCLTTPFHLTGTDTASIEAHSALLVKVAQGHPSSTDAHLSLAACRNDGRGQLWKVVKDTHDQDGVHGFKLQERDSAYCLRPGTVKANTKQSTKEVNGVFYPCTGVAHGTFELTTPNSDMPVWYDHNGVIKSDNGYCLDVPDDPQADASDKGSIVFLKECSDDEYDRWDYVVEYDKAVKIVNDFTGHCLYPYDQAEGAIAGAQHGQLVQRPCDGRYGQNWKMRVIPKQKWFQLEAVDKDKKATGTCMVADERNPGDKQVNVFVKSCNPASRGRWAFDHWKGTYQWTEWTQQNATTGGADDLSSIYWVSADSLQNNNKNGVCRVVIGDQNASNHAVYAGTWRGNQCGYYANGQIQNYDPSLPNGNDTIVEVLTGLDIDVSGATASWKSSSSGIPTDQQGQNETPPAPSYSAFLVGGDASHSAMYLCRVKLTNLWHYGYQSDGISCLTDAGNNVRTDMQVLVFDTVKNQDTSN
ncbi:MAG: RICIN domain-containing protein [Rhodospirillales bacterium]|nr:RICIN domain-containing protein [Rhodospirillales bacterium]MBO6788649.1 RICIN domain-containing protein [Rhodospirillales bacterium]